VKKECNRIRLKIPHEPVTNTIKRFHFKIHNTIITYIVKMQSEKDTNVL